MLKIMLAQSAGSYLLCLPPSSLSLDLPLLIRLYIYTEKQIAIQIFTYQYLHAILLRRHKHHVTLLMHEFTVYFAHAQDLKIFCLNYSSVFDLKWSQVYSLVTTIGIVLCQTRLT